MYLKTKLTRGETAAGLEIDERLISDENEIDFIDAGNRTLIVPIKSLDACTGMFPNESRLKTFCEENGIDVILIFCMDTKNPNHRAHTRVFAPKFGYLEDPATGSANSAFGFYMLKNNMWNGENITLEQGGIDRVYNVVNLSAENGSLLFGGSSTTRIDGVYYV